MKAAIHTDVIDVQALRVGMFVHLDVGWMSHPFPLSSFRITSPAQVATIRSLGLARVRWSPQQSDPSEPEPAGRGGFANAGRLDAAANDPSAAASGDSAAHRARLGRRRSAARRPSPPNRPSAWRGRERQRRLDAQREALAVCQRQYGEAARTCRHAIDIVPSRPHDARAEAEALGRALVDKMLGEQDLCIRMLGEGAGDKASMHPMNVAVVSLLMGRCFGFSVRRDARSRRRCAAARRRQARPAAAHAPSRRQLLAERGRASTRSTSSSAWCRRGAWACRRAPRRSIGQHHEHADGSGFPERLNSDRMTMGARIVALVNRYDNLCNPHLLARALTPHESLSLLFAQGRRKFDTSILGAFIKMMGVYPPGSIVQLTDDRYALVVSVNSSRPLKPSVLVHDAAVARDEALVLDLEQAAGLGIRRSVKPQQLPPTALEYLAPAKQRRLLLRAGGAGRRRGRAGVNNPLPVPPFSVAEAARRTWPALIESMLDAVCLVEPEGLRIVAANATAGRLLGVEPAELVGRDMHAMAATPEDACFWDEVAAGAAAGIVSDSYVLADGGAVVPVSRRVSRVEPAPGHRALRRRPARPQRAAARRARCRGRRRRARRRRSSRSTTASSSPTPPAISAISIAASRRSGACPTRCWRCAPTTRSSTGCAASVTHPGRLHAPPCRDRRRRRWLRRVRPPRPALGRGRRAGDPAAVQPRPADRPRLLVPLSPPAPVEPGRRSRHRPSCRRLAVDSRPR